jgi:hypothetical protein
VKADNVSNTITAAVAFGESSVKAGENCCVLGSVVVYLGVLLCTGECCCVLGSVVVYSFIY